MTDLKPSEYCDSIRRMTGCSEDKAFRTTVLAYLDEQHAAGQRDYVAPCTCEACTPVAMGSHVFVCADCCSTYCPKARNHRNKCSRVEGAAEAKPECHHHRLTKHCHECAPENGETHAPGCSVAEPPSPVAGERADRLKTDLESALGREYKLLADYACWKCGAPPIDKAEVERRQEEYERELGIASEPSPSRKEGTT